MNSAIRRSTSVVLPDFFQPAMPMTGVLRAAPSASCRGLGQHRAQLVQLLRRVGVEERIDARGRRRAQAGTARPRCRAGPSSAAPCARRPASCSSRSSASATGHRPITGCSSPCDWASAMASSAGSPRPACSRATRSRGSSGASPAAVTIQRAAGAFAADQRMPASTPASGPTKPATVSGTTGSPKAAKRAGSPLALMTMRADLRRQPIDDVAAASACRPARAAPCRRRPCGATVRRPA